ncbi:hypothetical protein AAU57_13750 [Nonlabens sp. YIK11]|uniref:hypothetical protein n=1 Tax=Nonlabens sp. YIK11 TaxID=1453349 RepID=UPI0006DD1381|nr:hypothetical protein [Nonlabens sp. YIK11]KQC34282.1 hypothetical protein AAU57_13750 [Nonlabens sp. YIK11]
MMRKNPEEIVEDMSVYTYATPFISYRSTDLKFYKEGEPEPLDALKGSNGYNFEKLLSPTVQFGKFSPMIEYKFHKNAAGKLRENEIENNKKFYRDSVNTIMYNVSQYREKNLFAIIRADKVNYTATSNKPIKLFYNGNKKSSSKNKFLFKPTFVKGGYASLPHSSKFKYRFFDINNFIHFLKETISKDFSITKEEFNEILALPTTLNTYDMNAPGYTHVINIAQKLEKYIELTDNYSTVIEKLME